MFERLFNLDDEKVREAMKEFKVAMDKVIKEKKAEMADKFEVGDKVSWNGSEGIVESINPESVLPLFVRFNDCVTLQTFTMDGKFRSWNRDASLVLISKKKKKVKRTYWFGSRDHWLLNGVRFTSNMYVNKLHADLKVFDGNLHSIEIEEEE
jgi:hypothetical protein